jgi:heme-degrading monooxygenase HmoA
MIERHWTGLARPASAQAYVDHLRGETFPALGGIAGFAGACILRREVARGVEFLVITRWESLAAIHAFAGADAEVAVVPGKVRAMMLEFDARARHYVSVS